MSNGGPHGDKWDKFEWPITKTSDDLLTILNLTPDGRYATDYRIETTADGRWLFVAYYGKDDDEQ